MKEKERALTKTFVLIGIIIALIWAFSPFYWAIITSFKRPKDVFSISYLPFVQFKPTLENWISEFQQRGPEIFLGISNSVIISLCTAGIALLLGTMAGYSLARFKFEKIKNESIAVWFFSLRILPPVVVIIPFFLIVQSLHLLDTKLALILINSVLVLPFAVLIARSIFRELPVELEESALVDGCSHFQAFVKIALPLSAPGLVAIALICLAFTWNEFLFALVLTYKHSTPISVVIAGTSSHRGIWFWYVATRTMIAIIPPVVISIFLQRYIVRGLTFGALKG